MGIIDRSNGQKVGRIVFPKFQTHPDSVFWGGYPNDMAMMMSFFTGEG